MIRLFPYVKNVLDLIKEVKKKAKNAKLDGNVNVVVEQENHG